MDDNGTYLGNIYGRYKEYLRKIKKNMYDRKYSETQAPPSSAPQWGGRPIGSVFPRYVSDHFIS